MKSQREYIQDSSSCPCCDDGNVEGGFVEIDGAGAFQNVGCMNCGFSWTDNYKLIGFHFERSDIPEIVEGPDFEPSDAEEREQHRLQIEAEEAARLDPYPDIAEQLTRHLSPEEKKARR